MTDAAFSPRAIAIGTLLGGVMALVNLNLGLRLGLGMGVSAIVALVGYGALRALHAAGRAAPQLHETNLVQTTASAGSRVATAGLVSAVPAWTLLSGQSLSTPALTLWISAVCLLGVGCAWLLRDHFLDAPDMPFPDGTQTGNLLLGLHRGDTDEDSSPEAQVDTRFLPVSFSTGTLWSALAAWLTWGKIALPGSTLAGLSSSAGSFSLAKLGFVFGTTPLAYAAGVFVPARVALTMAVASVGVWWVGGPLLLEAGWVDAAGGKVFRPLKAWTVYPGVALLILATLPPALGAMARGLRGIGGSWVTPRIGGALLAACVVLMALQRWLFGISLPAAAASVLAAFAIAALVGRVAGQAGVIPSGPGAKLSQVTLALVDPGNVTSNLMSAGLAAGAGAQCADLMNDLRAGRMVGANPAVQAFAQVIGVLAGAIVACSAYAALLSNPEEQLFTADLPAPAVATWKAIAELLAGGFEGLPRGAVAAMGAAAVIGAGVGWLERRNQSPWAPSSVGLGLAFLLPPGTALSIALGAVLHLGLRRWRPEWAARHVLVVATGLIVGESLVDAVRVGLRLVG